MVSNWAEMLKYKIHQLISCVLIIQCITCCKKDSRRTQRIMYALVHLYRGLTLTLQLVDGRWTKIISIINLSDSNFWVKPQIYVSPAALYRTRNIEVTSDRGREKRGNM